MEIRPLPLWSLYSKERLKPSLITKPWQIFPCRIEVFINCGTYLMHFIPCIISYPYFHASTLSTQWDPDLLLDMCSIISITPSILHWGLSIYLLNDQFLYLSLVKDWNIFSPRDTMEISFANMFFGGKCKKEEYWREDQQYQEEK